MLSERKEERKKERKKERELNPKSTLTASRITIVNYNNKTTIANIYKLPSPTQPPESQDSNIPSLFSNQSAF